MSQTSRIPPLTETQQANFWSKVEKGATENDCWTWTGCKGKWGYGKFGLGKTKTVYAHRISYFLHTGKDPHPNIILHSCRGRCVNPKHLRVGTPKENFDDMYVVRDLVPGVQASNFEKYELLSQIVHPDFALLFALSD